MSKKNREIAADDLIKEIQSGQATPQVKRKLTRSILRSALGIDKASNQNQTEGSTCS